MDGRGHKPQLLPGFSPGPYFTRQVTMRTRTVAVNEVDVRRPGQPISPAIDSETRFTFPDTPCERRRVSQHSL